MVISAGDVAREEEEDGASGDGTGRRDAHKKGVNKQEGARRSSGRCLLPEFMRGEGCRRQAFTADAVPSSGEAGGGGGVRVVLGRTRGEFSHSLKLVNSPLSL